VSEEKKRNYATWVAAVSTVVTLSLTALNAYWSNEIGKIENILKERQVSLDEEKSRLARYAFVQNLFDELLTKDEGKKNLNINLITLALNNDEAKQLFSGFATSENKDVEYLGSIGLSSIEIQKLVTGMNDSIKNNRLASVQTLISEYKNSTAAINEAIKMIEPKKTNALSASGRINVLVFLQNTNSEGWNENLVRRAREVTINMQERHKKGIARVGPQTEEALIILRTHLVNIESKF